VQERIATKIVSEELDTTAVCVKSTWPAVPPPITKSPKQIRRLPSNFASGIEIGANLQRAAGGEPGRNAQPAGEVHLGAGKTGRGSGPFVCLNYRIMADDRIADAEDRDVARGSLAGTTKRHTINFAQTNWIAFVERAKTQRQYAPAAAPPHPRSLSVIAEVALISSTEAPSTIKYCRATCAPLFNRTPLLCSRCNSVNSN